MSAHEGRNHCPEPGDLRQTDDGAASGRSRRTAYAALSRITKAFHSDRAQPCAIAWWIAGRGRCAYRIAERHAVVAAGARESCTRLSDCPRCSWLAPARLTLGNTPLRGRVFDSRSTPT